QCIQLHLLKKTQIHASLSLLPDVSHTGYCNASKKTGTFHFFDYIIDCQLELSKKINSNATGNSTVKNSVIIYLCGQN
ncbi:MAG: hypothetical protein LBB53_01900, partial [Prevotellaceae bacterium]|nr:hypothetical protein [Prevotellaceae bacterium]